MEDSIFGPKLARYFNLNSRDFDVVDNNDNIPSNIVISDVKNTKLSRQNNSNKINRNDLIKLSNFISLSLPYDTRFVPLHDVNDKATQIFNFAFREYA